MLSLSLPVVLPVLTALDPTLCGDFQSGSVSIDKETTPPPFHKGNELFYFLKSLYYNEVNNKIIMQLD